MDRKTIWHRALILGAGTTVAMWAAGNAAPTAPLATASATLVRSAALVTPKPAPTPKPTPTPKPAPWKFHNSPIGATGVSGSQICTIEVGTFSGPSSTASSYHATVSFGDSPTSSAASVVAIGGGKFVVATGCHRYTEAGTYYVAANVYEGAKLGGTLLTNATVSGVLVESTLAYNAAVGTPLCTIEVGNFNDSNGSTDPSTFHATLNYGDGTATVKAYVIELAPGPALGVAAGCHTFTAAGTYTATVKVTDADGAWATSELTFTVS